MQARIIKIGVIVARVALGVLFVYGGAQKFNPRKRPAKAVEAKQAETRTLSEQAPPDNTQKIKSMIGGLKSTGYFWPFLGVAELLCGILLLSQYMALLGAVMLVPLSLNILLFHLFLKPDDMGDLLLTALYFLLNMALLAYDYPRLKNIFLTHTPMRS